MAEHRISKVDASHTRTSAGKKIDSWRVALPDGPTEVVVMLHSGSDGIYFQASSGHPCLKDLSWEGTDLGALRVTAMEDVEKAARLFFTADWQPAIMLEASIDKTDREDTKRLYFSIDMVKLFVDPNKPVGNQGETQVLKGHIPQKIIQRGHNQQFEYKKRDLTSDNLIMSREQHKTASRVVVDSDMEEAVATLTQTLEGFYLNLLEKMAPDEVRMYGVPSPEDLALLLRDAIDNPKDEFDGDERNMDGFRI